MGSCTWGWGKPPCGLHSRMLGAYKTNEPRRFPAHMQKIRENIL